MLKLSGRSSALATTLREKIVRASRRPWNARATLALKTVLGLIVLFAVGRHIVQTWGKLHDQGQTLRIDPAWLGLGMILYLIGLCPFGVFFGRVMNASPTPVRWFPALRAYLISHLGKYVPGKAMVVVMRVGLVTPYGARVATATFATLYETMVMMAAGSLVALFGFILVPIELAPVMVALGLTLAFLVVVDPKVFPKIAALVSRPLKGVGSDALPKFTRRLLIEGLVLSSAGWILLGLSQVAVARAVMPAGAYVAVKDWPLVIASVALATVSGFVIAIFPGGLGVREWVLMVTLKPALGEELAVVSALALRLTWVLVEALATAFLTIARPRLPGARVPAP
jgi:glycosyltransferase 2 family protein